MIIIFVLLSCIGFILMGLDKYYAIKNKWRIKEKTLWVVAVFGGAFGMLLGMFAFRHKTKHTIFRVGLPFLTLSWIAFLIYLS